jgi:nucleoside-diphosphate-sugar epimerase
VVQECAPDYIVHLAGISYVAHGQARDFYETNVFGALNVLEACCKSGISPAKTILASSATVYGPREGSLSEELCPAPVNHYAVSKLGMEHMAANYFPYLNILLVRPFNYTGPGQPLSFVIPKIVAHYQRGEKYIELGNIDVIREFNDVRNIVEMYAKLLISPVHSEKVNICTGIGHLLRDVLQILQEITGKSIEVRQQQELIRDNEVTTLIGDNSRLKSIIGEYQVNSLRETLAFMLQAGTT